MAEQSVTNTKVNDKLGHDSLSSSDDDEKEHTSSVLHRLYDKDQSIPSIARSSDKADPKFKYNLTLGDLEYTTVTHFDGTQEALWFAMRKSIPSKPRKVFISIGVKRVCDIDDHNEQYRMRFHVYFNWLPTEKEYRSHYKAEKAAKLTKHAALILEWKPKWHPIVEFPDALEVHTKEWQMHESEGCFRMLVLPGFAQSSSSSLSSDTSDATAVAAFDSSRAKFIRAKLICDMTFSQRMELRYFPFDCQSLHCVIKENTEIHSGTKCVFLPELRRDHVFGVVDPNRWVINEWNFEQSVLEFTDLAIDDGATGNQDTTSAIVLSVKLSRRFSPIVINTFPIVCGLCAMSLVAFAIDYEAVGARLAYVIFVFLTIFFFDPNATIAPRSPASVSVLDTYMLCTYVFLVCSMIYHSWGNYLPHAEHDWVASIVFLSVFVGYNVILAAYMTMVRTRERGKLHLTYHELQQYEGVGPSSQFDIQHGLQKENGGISNTLAFGGKLST